MAKVKSKVLASLPEDERTAYLYIQQYIKDNGFSPSMEEIGAQFGKSAGGVQHLIYKLISKNLVKKIPRTPRSITVNEPMESR